MSKELNYLIHQVERHNEITKALGNENVSLSVETTDELIKTIQKLQQQNKRYREYLRRLQRATNRYPAEDMAYVVNKITSEALESDSND